MDRNRGGAEIRRGGAPSGHKRRRLEQHQQQQQTQNQHFNSYSNFSSEEETEHRKQQEDEDDGAHGSPVVSRRASRSRNEEDEEEDDDDLPPPVIRHRATSSWKFKEETAGVDLAVTVPRKLRTAMMKRHQDSPPRHPTDTPAKKLKQLSNGTRLSNPAHSDSPPPSIKSSSVKKTKPSVLSKPKEENQAKASPSKQELEIAETLFDLARMLSERPPSTTAAEDSKIAEKYEGKNEAEASNGSSMRSPQSPAIALPGTTTSQSTNANASYPGASKKKYHHSSKSKILDKSPIATSSISAPAASSSAPVAPVGRGKETVNDSQVHQPKDSTKPNTPVASELPVTNSSSGAAVNFPESQSTSQGKLPEKADAHVVANGNKIETNVQEYGDETSSSSPIAVTNDSIDASRSALATELTPKENATERLSNVLNTKVDDVTAKLDINKMDLPLNRHQTENEHLATNDSKEKEVLPNMELEKMNGATSEEKNVDLERKSMVQHFANESKNSDFGSGYAQCGTNDRRTETHEGGEKDSATEFFIKIEQQINERAGETDAKINLDKASGQTAESIDLSLAPSPLVKTERNDRNPLSMSIGALGSSSKQISAGKHIAGDLSMGLSVPTTEATTNDQKTASMLPLAHSSMALSWKHCATHVSICRFIDHEQQKSKFTWATASSKSANFCDSKSFFSSISLSPSLATIGKGLGDVKSASLILPPDLDSKVTDLALEPKKETVAAIDERASIEADVMDKSANLNVDIFGRKASSLPQMENGQLQPMTSLQIGNPFGPASGQSASNPAVSVSGHNTVGMNSVMAFGGNTVPINGLSFGTGNNPSGNIPNIPQFQHPVMSHPTFPISFSPGQVALAGGAHVSSQQAQQFFSNAYYNPHLVQSLSSTSSHQQSASASAMNDTIKQSSNNFGNVCGFGSLGIQQISWPSFYGGQSLLPSGMQQQQGKENNADAVAGNELSSSKKNVYSPNLSFVHAPIMTSSSPVVTTTSMSSAHQDTNAMTTAMSKDATQQQKSDPHNHPQSHLMMPSLQMSLKDTEAHPSLSSNKVSGNSSLLGLPNMTSYMTPQGATFHGIGNQILFQEQFASGQSHQVMIPSSNNQQAMQTQKAVLNALENSRANLNDASKSGRGEDIKGSAKHQPYWDTQHAIQGTPTSGGYNLSNVTSGSVNVIAPSTGDVSSLMYTNLSQFQNSKKQMARAKTPSTSVLSPPQAESTLITFSDRPTTHASNFASEPSGQIVFSAGQILDSSTHSRRQGNSSQMPQVKGNQRTQTPNTFSSASSQAMLTAMSRNQGHPSKTEQFWMDGGNPNSSRASPAPSVSSFSGSILPSSPTSKSGGGSTTPFGEKNLPKDSYSNQSRSSSVGPTEKKNPPSIIPNVASFLGSAAFSQNMSAMTFPIQMAPNPNLNQHQHQQQQQLQQQQQQQQQQLQQQQQQTQQKKNQSKQQQRKQHKSSQSSQSTTSMQQQSLQMQQMQNTYYQMNQSANQKHQVQYSDRQQHPLNSAQNHAPGDMHQHIKHLQNQERQQNTPTSGSASMQSQFENVQWQNLSHLHQHQQFFSTPFGIVTNGTLPAAPGSSADGATNNKRPSTPLNFGNSNTNMGSNSHRISMLQHGDYGPTRSDHSDKQQ